MLPPRLPSAAAPGMAGRAMILFVTLALGTVNFALHKAVLESRHPLLQALPWLSRSLGTNASLLVEFAMLLGALLLVAQGSGIWALFYAVYTAINAASAWLILSGRV